MPGIKRALHFSSTPGRDEIGFDPSSTHDVSWLQGRIMKGCETPNFSQYEVNYEAVQKHRSPNTVQMAKHTKPRFTPTEKKRNAAAHSDRQLVVNDTLLSTRTPTQFYSFSKAARRGIGLDYDASVREARGLTPVPASTVGSPLTPPVSRSASCTLPAMPSKRLDTSTAAQGPSTLTSRSVVNMSKTPGREPATKVSPAQPAAMPKKSAAQDELDVSLPNLMDQIHDRRRATQEVLQAESVRQVLKRHQMKYGGGDKEKNSGRLTLRRKARDATAVVPAFGVTVTRETPALQRLPCFPDHEPVDVEKSRQYLEKAGKLGGVWPNSNRHSATPPEITLVHSPYIAPGGSGAIDAEDRISDKKKRTYGAKLKKGKPVDNLDDYVQLPSEKPPIRNVVDVDLIVKRRMTRKRLEEMERKLPPELQGLSSRDDAAMRPPPSFTDKHQSRDMFLSSSRFTDTLGHFMTTAQSCKQW